MNIVLTGGIAAGKSTITKMLLAKLPGWTLFDFDAIMHSFYDADKSKSGTASYFRQQVLERFGTLDREKLSDIVFEDASKRRQLERLSMEVMTSVMQQRARQDKIIYDFPLYFEYGEAQLEEYSPTGLTVVVVTAPRGVRRARTALRGHPSLAKFDTIVGSQTSSAVKCALADYVIDTNQTKAEIDRAVSRVVRSAREDDLKRLFLDQNHSEQVWEYVQRAYADPSRNYHGLSHLVHLFDEYKKVEHLIGMNWAVQLAIWFHDYDMSFDPGYKNNESDSVASLYRFATDPKIDNFKFNRANSRAQLIAAMEMIMCTRGHRIESPYITSKAGLLSDTQLFLDMDLSGFAADEAVWDVLDEAVASEYWQVPDFAFAVGRINVLKGFLDRPKIFLSEYYAPQENKARANLKRTIKKYQDRIDAHNLIKENT